MERFNKLGKNFNDITGNAILLTNLQESLPGQLYENNLSGGIYALIGHANINSIAVFLIRDNHDGNFIASADEVGADFTAIDRSSTYILHGFTFFAEAREIIIPHHEINKSTVSAGDWQQIISLNLTLDDMRRAYFDQLRIHRPPRQIYLIPSVWKQLQFAVIRAGNYRGDITNIRVKYKGNINVQSANTQPGAGDFHFDF